MDKFTLFERSDRYLFGSILTLLVILIIALFFAAQPIEKECTLYFIGNDEAVCDGVLVEHRGTYTIYFDFECRDGRKLNQLTNFRVENCTSE